MTVSQRSILAIFVIALCVAATQFAVRGRHEPTGNTGWLGNDFSGVEGTAGNSASIGVVGSSVNGNLGYLGTLNQGVFGAGTTVLRQGVAGTNQASGTIGYLGGGTYGVHGVANGFDDEGVWGESASGTGVFGNGGDVGVWGQSGASTVGVVGHNTGDGIGVQGQTAAGNGTSVFGIATGGTGIAGQATNGVAVNGMTGPNGIAIRGSIALGGAGYAGEFFGRVNVIGQLTKSSGSFKIDHPLEPETKYLSHSFVESPDMKNMYDGVVELDADGSAVVVLPRWFEALNKDFRYQLTCIGEHAPVYIAEKIRDNRFRIAGGYAGMEVSWLVTGSRRDVYAAAYPVPVEEQKAPHEVGRFLHPELYGKPASQRVGYQPRNDSTRPIPARVRAMR